MSHKTDLERRTRESYGLICEYQEIISTSGDPKERARSRRVIAEQWALIKDYLAEYKKLAPTPWPVEIAEIAAHFDNPPPAGTAGTPASAVFDQRGQQVGTQINVAGDYIDLRQTAKDDEAAKTARGCRR